MSFFGSTLFGWLRSIHANILFMMGILFLIYTFFYLRPLAQEGNLDVKQGLGLQGLI
jgi:hypothetical protein